MTDEAPRRRTNDVEAADLYPKIEAAVEGIGRLDEDLTKVVEILPTLAPADHIHQQLEDNVNQIIDVLEGPSVAQPFGQPAIRSDGLVDKVNTLITGQEEFRQAIGNGGFKIRLPATAWVAIIVAIIAGIAQVWSAIAGAGG